MIFWKRRLKLVWLSDPSSHALAAQFLIGFRKWNGKDENRSEPFELKKNFFPTFSLCFWYAKIIKPSAAANGNCLLFIYEISGRLSCFGAIVSFNLNATWIFDLIFLFFGADDEPFLWENKKMLDFCLFIENIFFCSCFVKFCLRLLIQPRLACQWVNPYFTHICVKAAQSCCRLYLWWRTNIFFPFIFSCFSMFVRRS